MIKQVFVSYSRDDYPFVRQLVDDLTAFGVDIWLDQRDIKAGQRWDTAVQKALRESEYFLVVLSPVSVNSDNVLDEISYGLTNNKRVFPVLYQDCDIPYRLARVQYVDIREDYQVGLDRLIEEMKFAGVPITLPVPEDEPGPQEDDLIEYETPIPDIGNEDLSEATGPEEKKDTTRQIPIWAWVLGGLMVLVIAVLLFSNGGEIIGIASRITKTPTSSQTPPIPTNTTISIVHTQPTSTRTPELSPSRTPTRTPTPHPFIFEDNCTNASPPCVYTVKEGDYFSLISLELYGNEEYTPLIMSMNREEDGYRRSLRPGDRLFIPTHHEVSLDDIAQYLYPQCSGGLFPCWYRAGRGDAYPNIANKLYGDADDWEIIAKVNWIYDSSKADPLVSPKIVEGLILVIPKKR